MNANVGGQQQAQWHTDSRVEAHMCSPKCHITIAMCIHINIDNDMCSSAQAPRKTYLRRYILMPMWGDSRRSGTLTNARNRMYVRK